MIEFEDVTKSFGGRKVLDHLDLKIQAGKITFILGKSDLYDEPTTGMDPLVSEMIDALIVQVAKEEKGLTSVVVSHDMKAALTRADDIEFLYKGKIEQGGPPQAFHASKDLFTQQFFAGKVEGPMEFF